jgi:hypothetical protein
VCSIFEAEQPSGDVRAWRVNSTRYLRWALVEAATHAAPVYRDRYQQTKTRIGKQRGAKVAQVGPRPPAHRSDLAPAHPQPTLRSQRPTDPLAA